MVCCYPTGKSAGVSLCTVLRNGLLDQISGVITGFDRLVFRGNLALNHESGRKGYRWANGVAWKDYARHAGEVSQRVKPASLASMEAGNRPIRYRTSGKESQEQMARAIAREDGIVSADHFRLQGPPQRGPRQAPLGDEMASHAALRHRYATPRRGLAENPGPLLSYLSRRR